MNNIKKISPEKLEAGLIKLCQLNNFNLAQNIWNKFGGEKIEAFILFWGDKETYLANIVEKPDETKAPRSNELFPEIGYHGSASIRLNNTHASVGLNHVLPKNIPLEDWASFEELQSQLSLYGLVLIEEESDYKDVVLARENICFYCSAFENNILIDRIEFS